MMFLLLLLLSNCDVHSVVCEDAFVAAVAAVVAVWQRLFPVDVVIIVGIVIIIVIVAAVVVVTRIQ